MATLHRHLQLRGSEHDRLEFRPDCPHCQGRLAGRYPSSHLLSRRGEATLATAAVLAGTLLPAAGAAADLNVNAGDTHAKLRFNPPAVVVDNGDQGGGDHDARQSDHGATSSSSSSAPAPAHTPDVTVDLPPAHRPAAAPPPPQEPTPAPKPSSAPAPVDAPSAPSPSQAQAQAPTPGLVITPQTQDAAPRSQHAGSTISAAGPTKAPAAAENAPAAVQATSKGASGARGQHAAQGSSKIGRRGASSRRGNSSPAQLSGDHVVRSGECLWTIAERMLGEHASDARIAAAVERLWQLNAGRIATGNPNLIYPGQTLTMPWTP